MTLRGSDRRQQRRKPMPRIHDFDRDPSRSDEDYIWSIFRDRRQGRGELSEVDLWGPQAIFHFDGLHHQFRLKTPDGTSPYDTRWSILSTAGLRRTRPARGTGSRGRPTTIGASIPRSTSRTMRISRPSMHRGARSSSTTKTTPATTPNGSQQTVMPGNVG
jgi:hypothetical protein